MLLEFLALDQSYSFVIFRNRNLVDIQILILFLNQLSCLVQVGARLHRDSPRLSLCHL
jgi:hypothetical protein